MSELAKIKDHPLLKPNIMQVVEDELFETVKSSVAKSYADMNIRLPDDSEYNYLINEVADSILKNYPSLRLHEIPVAFANGIRKKYGDYYGLSVISFEGFLTGYLNSDERLKLVKEASKIQLSTPAEPTAEEKFALGKNLCTDLFERFKANSLMDRTATAVYEFLKPLNIIHKDYKVGVYKQGLEQSLITLQMEASLCLDPMKRRKLNADVECLSQNIANDMITHDQHQNALREGKKIILKNWFNDLLLDEVDLGELIKM